MDPILLLTLLTRITGGVLISQGQPELGALLGDLATAAKQGKAVDDIMAKIAEQWEAEGPPSSESIAAHRQSIQGRIDA